MRYLFSFLYVNNKPYSFTLFKGFSLILILVLSRSHAQSVDVKVVTEQWPPHIKLDESGRVSGVIVDKVALIMADANLSYSIDIYPWSRAYQYSLINENVLIFPIFKTKKREALFHFICPLTKKLELYFIKLSSRSDINITALDDAKKYIVGLNRNDYGHNFLLKNGFKNEQQLDVNSDDLSSLRKLMKGRIDLMIQSKNSIMSRLELLGEEKPKITFAYKLKSEGVGDNCIALSKGTSQPIIDKVRASLAKVNNLGPLLDVNK